MNGVTARMTEMAVLLIGIHEDELAFGDGVASSLGDQVDVLRVDEGLNGGHPTPDELFLYRIRHAEMYHQVLQRVARKDGPVIDLHTGVNKSARCADVYCHNQSFLHCLEVEISSGRHNRFIGPEDVRLVQIVSHQRGHGEPRAGGDRPVVWTYIPEKVWRNPRFLYVGIEVYLPGPGSGNDEDHRFAGALVGLATDCAARTAAETRHRSTPSHS